MFSIYAPVVRDQVANLSMQKFSSNVIEKCMDRASEEVIVIYVQELADPAAMRPLLQVWAFSHPIPHFLFSALTWASFFWCQLVYTRRPVLRSL